MIEGTTIAICLFCIVFNYNEENGMVQENVRFCKTSLKMIETVIPNSYWDWRGSIPPPPPPGGVSGVSVKAAHALHKYVFLSRTEAV